MAPTNGSKRYAGAASRYQLRAQWLSEFKKWLDANKIAHRPGRLPAEVLSVCLYAGTSSSPRWHGVFKRTHLGDLLAADFKLEVLISLFMVERKPEYVVKRNDKKG